ncbi:hypothetical protein MXD81_05420 [Microbacteriaceae bacterium K1510]|nr:hypothetical protein [Microbacteriaceae bacterium K1510]
MSDLATPEQRQRERITDWLLAVLRFAVTRNEADRASLLATANELDRPQLTAEVGSFAFFRTTTIELCATIAGKHDEQRVKILRRHFNHIGNLRLRAALEAATGLKEADQVPAASPRHDRAYLWKGL